MDSLYLEIFGSSLQPFLKPKDYGNLMNISKQLAREIKSKTISYQIKGDKCFPMEELLESVKHVKYPKKQIHLNLKNISHDELMKIRSVSEYLWKLTVNTGFSNNFSNTFDFTLFDGIPVVQLLGFEGVTRVTNGLQNIQDLALNLRSLQFIYDFNTTGSFKRLNFHGFGSMNCLPKQQGESQILSLFPVDDFQHYYSLTFEKLPSQRRMELDHLFQNHLQYVSLDITNLDLSTANLSDIFAHVPSLHLHNSNRLDTPVTLLTRFLGKKLRLEGLNVCHIWVMIPPELPHLESFILIRCVTPAHLPALPAIKYLEVEDNPLLERIPTFKHLSSLILHNLPALYQITDQPNLKEIKIFRCPNLSDLYLPADQIYRSVHISSCPKLRDLSLLSYAYSLQVTDLSGLETIHGNRRSNIPIEISSRYFHWTISDIFHDYEQFTASVSNIYDLTIMGINYNFMLKSVVDMERMEILKVDEDIPFSNISRFRVGYCHAVTSTKKMFSKIHESLLLQECYGLTSLDDLQYIPKLALCLLKNVKDISGLGHHDQVYVYEVAFLEQAARDYRADQEAGVAPELCRHGAVFSTIKSLTILEPSSPPDRRIVRGDLLSWEDMDKLFIHHRLW